jgi:hypothetical protein
MLAVLADENIYGILLFGGKESAKCTRASPAPLHLECKLDYPGRTRINHLVDFFRRQGGNVGVGQFR